MDFASIMQNPQFAAMAQQLMSNPEMMSGLLNNPMLQGCISPFFSFFPRSLFTLLTFVSLIGCWVAVVAAQDKEVEWKDC